MIKKAIIPAAGYGTRGLPITKVIPKEMFPIGGKPAIHYIVEEAASSGIEDILIIISRDKNMILDYFDRSLELETYLKKRRKSHLLDQMSLPNVHIQYVRQSYALGLGHAISLGERFTGNEPFAVLLPDDLIVGGTIPGIAQLIKIYQKYEKNIIALNQVKEHQLKNYGVIKGMCVTPLVHKVTDIVEKPKVSPPSNLAVVGRYILIPEIYQALQQVTPDENDEIQLTDALKRVIHDSGAYGVELNGKRYDTGTQAGYEEAFINMSNIKDEKPT